jgi:hypothetical protein
VVSVHPIDASTWAAASLGDNGRCYAELIFNPSPNLYQDYYAQFPDGTSCTGGHANRSTVTLTVVPN